ncbi:Serine/threonine-protein phosphatase 6 regulatory ankyrin repeat subunit C [Metarhizium anisopliae]|nr:Serine/threonine-protein phosphatase 6 regulatory ankyrin repeat subunit C [Metarhizium anisopliae]
MENRKARILCLDGGGVRGITSLCMLKNIMTEIRTQEEMDAADCGDENIEGKANNDGTESRSTTPLKPCEYFDLICGTSTGGLIALMLGRLEYTVDEAIEQYMNLGKEIFGKRKRCFKSSKYDHNILEKCLKKVVRESHLGDENALMKDESCRCRTFVVSAHLNKHADEYEDDATILRSYDLQALQPEYAFHGKIWEAGRATSAAPTFFKPISIDPRGESSNTSGVIEKASRKLKAETNKKDSYSDGGTVANNPCSIAVREAGRIWGYGNIGCIVSLGTGPEPKFTLDQATKEMLGPKIMWLSRKLLTDFFYLRLQLAFYSLQKMTRTEHVHKETRDLVTTFINANEENEAQAYFRFNVESEMARVRLDSWDKMPQLQKLAGEYMGFEDVVQKTMTIAEKLKKVRTNTQTLPRTRPGGRDYVSKLRILTPGHGPPQKAEALIDSSVKYNFVSKALVDRLKMPTQRTLPTAPEITFFQGDKARPRDETWIYFSRDGRSDYFRDRFYVLNQAPVPYELIIGSNFHQDHGPVLLEPPPLALAAARADEAVIRRLLKQGVDVEARDAQGSTPLYHAIDSDSPHIVQLLLENGADAAATDNYGIMPLHKAAARGNKAIVKLLLEKDVDLEAKNPYERTVLLDASYKGHEAVVKLLLDKGADTEARDFASATSLHFAVRERREAVVRLLLDKGADTETKDFFLNTPLIYASYRANGAIIKLLLEKGADFTVKDRYGHVPLRTAVDCRRLSVAKLLVEHGAYVDESNLSEAAKAFLDSILGPAVD